MEPSVARRVLGLVVEEAEVLHARVLLAAALLGGAEAGSGASSNENGSGSGSAEVGSSAAAGGSAGAQYSRLASVAETLLAEWRCVLHPAIDKLEKP